MKKIFALTVAVTSMVSFPFMTMAQSEEKSSKPPQCETGRFVHNDGTTLNINRRETNVYSLQVVSIRSDYLIRYMECTAEGLRGIAESEDGKNFEVIVKKLSNGRYGYGKYPDGPFSEYSLER